MCSRFWDKPVTCPGEVIVQAARYQIKIETDKVLCDPASGIFSTSRLVDLSFLLNLVVFFHTLMSMGTVTVGSLEPGLCLFCFRISSILIEVACRQPSESNGIALPHPLSSPELDIETTVFPVPVSRLFAAGLYSSSYSFATRTTSVHGIVVKMFTFVNRHGMVLTI